MFLLPLRLIAKFFQMKKTGEIYTIPLKIDKSETMFFPDYTKGD